MLSLGHRFVTNAGVLDAGYCPQESYPVNAGGSKKVNSSERLLRHIATVAFEQSEGKSPLN